MARELSDRTDSRLDHTNTSRNYDKRPIGFINGLWGQRTSEFTDVLFWLEDSGSATTIGNAAARKAGKYEPVGEVRNCDSEGNRNLGQVAAAETTPNGLTSPPLPTYEFHAMLTCDKAWCRRLAR